MLEAAIVTILPLCLAYAAMTDLLAMTIPNRVSIILAVAFLLLAPLAGLPPLLILLHVAAALVVLVVCFGLFAAGVMGGGDAKLLSASALWMGLGAPLLAFVVYTTLIGGALTLAFMALRARSDALLASGLMLPPHFHDGKAGIPYGVAIAIAGFIVFPETPLMQLVLAGAL